MSLAARRASATLRERERLVPALQQLRDRDKAVARTLETAEDLGQSADGLAASATVVEEDDVAGTRVSRDGVDNLGGSGAGVVARADGPLHDALTAMAGDATLYTRQDMVEASWAVVQPIQEAWRSQKFDFPNYAAATWGPVAAEELLARRGHAWRRP